MKVSSLAVFSAMSLALSGCGGKTPPTLFSSFASTAPGNTYTMEAIGLFAEYEADEGSGEVSPGVVEFTEPEVLFTLDGGGSVTQASLEVLTPPGFNNDIGIAFDTANGDVFSHGETLPDDMADDYWVAVSAGGDRAAIVANPADTGFEYQSFGIWATGIDNGSGFAGVASAGSPTPASGIPTDDVAHYEGLSSGFYIDPDGKSYLAFADFGATVNFGETSIIVWTNDTEVMATSDGATSSMDDVLDFAGAGDLLADGSFMANIAAPDLLGQMDGLLYGPSAEELGAVFAMEGDAGVYMGAVGAAQ